MRIAIGYIGESSVTGCFALQPRCPVLMLDLSLDKRTGYPRMSVRLGKA